MQTMMKYYKGSILLSVLGGVCAFFIGQYYSGTVAGGLSALFLATVLSVLEISLSFDNAVVNAIVLKKMTPLWQRRFLTWGVLIAVFGMRLVFPLLLVGVVAHLNPIDALVMAATKPDEYAQIMLSAHVSIAAYGGAFLMMVALKYFFEEGKDVHWISIIEAPIAKLGRMEAVEIGVTLITLYVFSGFQVEHDKMTFLISGVWGIVTYIAVDGIGAFLQSPDETEQLDLNKASIGMFLYLEVLDASFSFDGVVGAFAITNNLFIIMIGLGVGAMFVRSITIMLVDKGTLSEYRYLEHGAFYAIGILAVIMFAGTIQHIPEVITGLLGAAFIALSLLSSIRWNKKHAHS
ncbi:DUF475 domain-containing protein [Peredibacter starrii]|uniref:DUF475 domain-containing protein n=1 Tax=Peredibacter starrii TaxID=28202 RepID=A0AAX4HK16_9BACT|nr:DUF475 domain-containing protein [Peredibacter starrii]WPU63541.1 DUF475 domain-containing protein [Peredibacter starrii]